MCVSLLWSLCDFSKYVSHKLFTKEFALDYSHRHQEKLYKKIEKIEEKICEFDGLT